MRALTKITLFLAMGGCSAGATTTGRGSTAETRPKGSAAVGDKLPVEMRLEALEPGKAASLGSLIDGKVAVIDLWATWCEPCRDVSKKVELLAKAHEGTDLVVIGLSIGEERKTVSAFFAASQPSFPIFLDPELRVADALDAGQVPTLFVVDRTGRIRARKRKVDAELVALVDRLLAEAPPSFPKP